MNIFHFLTKNVTFEVPMKLNLYNKCNSNIDTIFKWEPFEKQWWITGFNPEYEPVVENQVMIGTLDLSEHEDIWDMANTVQQLFGIKAIDIPVMLA